MSNATVTADGATCPCGKALEGQFDTDANEPFWHCFDCDQSFTLTGRPAFYMTSVPLDDE